MAKATKRPDVEHHHHAGPWEVSPPSEGEERSWLVYSSTPRDEAIVATVHFPQDVTLIRNAPAMYLLLRRAAEGCSVQHEAAILLREVDEGEIA